MPATLNYMRVNFETSDLYHRTFLIAAARLGGSLRKLFEHLADTHLQSAKKDAADALGIDPHEERHKPPRRKPTKD